MPSAIKNIYLHVGIHKTGTSSIQDSLYHEQNNQLLKKHGYLYPRCWPPNHSDPIHSVFCDDPTKYFVNILRKYTPEQIKQINETYLADLEKTAEESGCDKLILSAEAASVLPPHNIQRLKDYLETTFPNSKVKVIAYVREPISWAVSSIQQTIRGAGDTYSSGFKRIKESMGGLYRYRLKKFTEIFGEKSVKVYRFEDAIKYHYGIVGHFLRAIGVKESDLKNYSIIRSNEGSSLVAIDIISFINEKIPLFLDGKLNPKRSDVDCLIFSGIRGTKFDIPVHDKFDLMEINYEDAVWLKKNFGIDYLKPEIKPGNVQLEFSPETIKDIQIAFSRSSIEIKFAVIEYLKSRESDFKQLSNLIKLLEAEANLIHSLRIPPRIESADLYRDIALFMERRGDISCAKVLMEYARTLRPDGEFIRKKCEEYNQQLMM